MMGVFAGYSAVYFNFPFRLDGELRSIARFFPVGWAEQSEAQHLCVRYNQKFSTSTLACLLICLWYVTALFLFRTSVSRVTELLKNSRSNRFNGKHPADYDRLGCGYGDLIKKKQKNCFIERCSQIIEHPVIAVIQRYIFNCYA